MPKIEDVAGIAGAKAVEHLARFAGHDFRRSKQYIRVEITLQGHLVANATTRFTDIDRPVKANAIAAVLPGLEARKGEIAERIRQGYLRKGIELKVEGKIHPGVLIKVENQSLRISEEVSGPRYLTYYDERIHLY